MNIKKIINIITKRNRIPRILFMLIGVFLLALNYNLFFRKYNIITGSMSSLAIVFEELWGWNYQIFIYVSNFLLLLLSFILLGKNKTRSALIGSIIYPFFITFTEPLSDLLSKYFVFEDYITIIAITSIIHGFACGLIYKMGYDTGGSDIIMKIMSKYLHMPEGKANLISSILILIIGGFTLGVPEIVYGIIVIYISSLIVDRMIIGISKSKLFIIESEKLEEIKDVIMNDLKLGVTVISSRGGYSNKKKDLLLCAVPTSDYYLFKEIIEEIDHKAFFIINDCYDLEGGTIRRQNFSLDDFL